MKNALTTYVGMLEDLFLWLSKLDAKVIYLVKQACGNDKRACVYAISIKNKES